MINRLIGYLLFQNKVGNYLFKIFLGIVYDVFWIVGYIKGMFRR
jgi:hypothetical protein